MAIVRKRKALDTWLLNFQAEVDAFSRTSNLSRAELALALGYSAPSVVSKALDPVGTVPEAFICRVAATFDEFRECFRDYAAIKARANGQKVPVHLVTGDNAEMTIEMKRAEIRQKHREIMSLYSDLEVLVVNEAQK